MSVRTAYQRTHRLAVQQERERESESSFTGRGVSTFESKGNEAVAFGLCTEGVVSETET